MHAEDQHGLYILCVRRALKFYLLKARDFRDDGNIELFLTCVRVTKVKHVSKQHIYKWLVETISYAYVAHDYQVCQCRS